LEAAALPFGTVAAVVAAVQGLHMLGWLPIFLPAPSDLWAAFWDNPGVILAAMAPTLGKAVVAFAIAAVLALAGAGIGAAFTAAYAPIYNFGATLQAIPVIATAPLFAVWFGTGPSLQIIIAVLSSQFPMLAGAMQGFGAVDTRQRELFHTLSASKIRSFRYLTLPAALAYVFAGLKVAAPAAVLGTITAEWAGAERGVGALMLNALFSYDPPTVWLSVIAACTLAGGFYAFWAAVERVVVFWERPSELSE
jgi:ABC-type nitrate/sulfonate/bicarbonate transport system permease component